MKYDLDTYETFDFSLNFFSSMHATEVYPPNPPDFQEIIDRLL